MVERQSMTTVADVVSQVRDGRLEDFVREAVVLVARELMEAEISTEVGAGLGEVAPEARVTYRISPAGVGDPGWGDRPVDPQKAGGVGVLPEFFWSRAGALSRRSSRSCWRRM